LNTLHVDLGEQWRGGQNQALLLIEGLRSRGQGAELAALRGGLLAERCRAGGIPVHLVDHPGSRFHAARLLGKLLDGQPGYQIVHCHDAHGLTAAWVARAHKRAAVVASRRVAYPLSRNRWALGRYRCARRIVAVSRFVAESAIASGMPPELVEVIYDGVETPPRPSPEDRRRARRPWNLPAENAPLLGCVGYLLPEKNQALLVRALPKVRARYPDCHLLLAGDGPCRADLERLARQTGVADSVQFAGIVNDVAQVYAALDIFVFPSFAEPLGSSLLAAMGYGLPAVAVAGGAVPEIIRNETNGLLIPDPDPEDFAGAVLRLLDDPALAGRLGDAARQTVERQFSTDRMVEDTLDLYGRICSGSPQPCNLSP
jgi:glycosyltransferase involved in cell wall biosynthesis